MALVVNLFGGHPAALGFPPGNAVSESSALLRNALPIPETDSAKTSSTRL